MAKKPKFKLYNGLYVKEVYIRIEDKITTVIGAKSADILFVGNNKQPILRSRK